MVDHRIFQIEGHTLAALPLNPGATGEPLVLVHGVMGNIATWQVNPLPSVLAKGPCYALSLPGHYPGAFPAGFRQDQLTAEMLARVMAGAIRQLAGERPVTLIGHSTGGFAVLNLAAFYSGLARRVVSAAGFAHGRWTGALGVYQALVRTGRFGRAFFKFIHKLAALSPAIFKLIRFHSAAVAALYTNPDTAEALAQTFSYYQHLDLEAMVQYFTAMPEIDITPLLPGIQAPILVIAGERDPTVPPDQSRKIASLVPHAQLVMIPDAGHLSFLERPPEYQRALSAWLNKTA